MSQDILHNNNTPNSKVSEVIQSTQPVQLVQLMQPLCQLCGVTKTSTNYLWDIWSQKSIKIHGTNLTLCGFSIAALRTNFFIRELNIMFDAGLSSNFTPSHIFVTHLHTDHTANCPWHINLNPGQIAPGSETLIYVPQFAGKKLEKFIEASHPFQAADPETGKESELTNKYKIIEVVDRNNFDLVIKGTKYVIEIIRCYHSVRCTSYGLIETKRKLKQEYIGMKGQEIKALKDSGVDIYTELQIPFFLYVGDTSAEILGDERLLKYSNIMIECSFLDTDEEERAIETKHIHWNHLEKYVRDNPNITFILYHFSQRYKREFINDFFAKLALPNVIVWNCN